MAKKRIYLDEVGVPLSGLELLQNIRANKVSKEIAEAKTRTEEAQNAPIYETNSKSPTVSITAKGNSNYIQLRDAYIKQGYSEEDAIKKAQQGVKTIDIASNRTGSVVGKIGKELGYFTPIVGTSMFGANIIYDAMRGDYKGALGNTALALGLGATSKLAGKVVKKGLNAAINYSDKTDKTIALKNALKEGVNNATKNGNLNFTSKENPLHGRFKLGDVEINDPNLYYRQVDEGTISRFHNPSDGSQFAPEKVFTQEELDNMSIAERFKARLKGGLDNPMYAQGELWYGIPNDKSSKTELLVTHKELPYANKHSYEVSDKIRVFDGVTKPVYPDEMQTIGARRADIYGVLNPTNTKTYEFVPNYGYKLVNPTAQSIQNVLDVPISYNKNSHKRNLKTSGRKSK